MELAARLAAVDKRLDGAGAPALKAVKVELGVITVQLRQLGGLPEAVVSRACRPNTIFAALEFVELAELLAARPQTADIEWRQLRRTAEGLALPVVVPPDATQVTARSEATGQNDMQAWVDLAGAYEDDAKRLTTGAGRLRIAAATAFVCLAVLGFGTLALRALRPNGDEALLYSSAAMIVVLATFAGFMFQAATRQGAAAEEATRMARHTALVPSYAALSPSGSVSALQIALAPRLFARTLQDDDPVREPLWPTLADLSALTEASKEPPQDAWPRWRGWFRQTE